MGLSLFSPSSHTARGWGWEGGNLHTILPDTHQPCKDVRQSPAVHGTLSKNRNYVFIFPVPYASENTNYLLVLLAGTVRAFLNPLHFLPPSRDSKQDQPSCERPSSHKDARSSFPNYPRLALPQCKLSACS